MPWQRLEDRLHWLWLCWAPAVLAANGDIALEDAALQRPSILAARTDYFATLRAIAERDTRPVQPYGPDEAT